MTMYVALFGGAFNPIHQTHIEIAYNLSQGGFFDEVWIVPCYQHLYGKQLIPAEDRLKMCELALPHKGRIKVFDYEIKHQLSGSAYDFVQQLLTDPDYKEYKFWYVMGQDNAINFNWVKAEELKQMIPFVVIPRQGDDILGDAWFLKTPHRYLGYFRMSGMSSTAIRNALKVNPLEKPKGLDTLVWQYLISKRNEPSFAFLFPPDFENKIPILNKPKPFEKLYREIIDLLERSLEEKWYSKSNASLDEWCPFCYHACYRATVDFNLCEVCLCPDSICFDGAKKGFIQALVQKYNELCKIKDLHLRDLLNMQVLFAEEIDILKKELNI